MAEIKVLGPIRGFREGEPVDLGGPTQRRLLACLLAQPGEVVAVPMLLEALWGDDPPPSGPQSIQSYVSRLRRGLGQHVIVTRAPGYRLDPDAVVLDSSRFMEIVGEFPNEPGQGLELIEEALDLWEGPPFEGFEHVDFASRRLIEARLDLEEQRARLLSESGRHSEAIAALRRVTATEALRESAWLVLSEILIDAGRQAEAVRALDEYRDNLADIGLEPGAGFSAAMDAVFASPPPIIRSPLPQVETTFVGREEELEELREQLRKSRLVTVSGPGGMGKSRLAIEALREWSGLPLAVTRLAGLRDDGEVGPAVLSAVGGEARGNALDAVVARLARSPALLLLDNAEHVIEATARLASQVLSRTQARMVVTSREPLNVLGETVVSLDSLDPSSAIALFEDRAVRVSPGFDASAATLDMLCESLDYMPLAIEMAAARSKALPPGEILTRLGTQYGLLDKPLRGGSGRHRSLDTLVDWSYGLLEETEQRVFERLSVIAGTFDVDFAVGVAGFRDVASAQVPASLASLVEKSLVNPMPTGAFRMLRVLRSYARRKLEAGDDESAARSAHSRHMASLATQIGDGLSSPDETQWIDTANRVVNDMGVALRWAVESREADTAQHILEGLFDWFYHRHPPAITTWGDLAIQIAEGHDLASVANAWAAIAAVKRSDLAMARELALTGTRVEGAAGRFAWFMAGDVACYLDHLDEARDAFRKQLVRASSAEDVIGVVDGVAGETIALAFQGHFDEATDLAADLSRLASRIGAPTYQAYAQYAMGEAVIVAEPERSADLLDSAAILAESVNNQFIQAMARTTRSSVLSRLDRLEEAVADIDEAAVLWDGLVVPNYRWVTVQYIGAILGQLGESEVAVRLLAAAQEEGGRRPFTAGQAHWGVVVAGLEAHESYQGWWDEGASLTLDSAIDLALSTIRRLR